MHVCIEYTKGFSILKRKTHTEGEREGGRGGRVVIGEVLAGFEGAKYGPNTLNITEIINGYFKIETIFQPLEQ